MTTSPPHWAPEHSMADRGLAQQPCRLHRDLLPVVAEAERQALAALSDDDLVELSALLARLATTVVLDPTPASD